MIPLHQAVSWLASHIGPLNAMPIPLDQATSRVLAESILFTPLPPHPTAAIEGLAIRAADTEGASDYAPMPLQGIPIVAGAELPHHADAVLPLHLADQGPTALAPVAPGHGVTQKGHHVPAGYSLSAGTRLTPLHVALLSWLGHATVDVLRRPRIALPPGAAMLQAVLPRPDDAGPPDLMFVSDNAAFTTRHTPAIAIYPGEDTALGLVGATPAIRLPSDPLEAFIAATVLIEALLRLLTDQQSPASFPATLTGKIVSPLGQHGVTLVQMIGGGHATPLPCSLIEASSAHGFVLAHADSEGYSANATVQVYPL